MFHGYGKLLFTNGDVYLGEFRSNKMHDEDAVIRYANSDEYHGAVAMSMKHAKDAKYVYSNGDVYHGDFRGDKKAGQGTISLFSGDIVYTGDFENDRKTGHGEVTIKSAGITLVAEFDEHELVNTDHAEMHMQDLEYTGGMRNSAFGGKGVLKHLDTGNEYQGEFKDNHKHGPCTFILIENDKEDVFTGEFKHGVEMSAKSNYGRR
mmetsp:Transcript_23003/g.26381  ORF Transcript_23003/g.26381 Transcript_23003/m.26381 type:complete len:206 (+) Transcript_23003:724-1341(+)